MKQIVSTSRTVRLSLFNCLPLVCVLLQPVAVIAGSQNRLVKEPPQEQRSLWESPNRAKPRQHTPESEGWVRISEPDEKTGYFYAPFSISKVSDGVFAVTTLINYISDEGNAESLIGVTNYDCARRVKQEQSTIQYSQQWGDGVILIKLGFEPEWTTVKIGSDGMSLLKTVCSLR